MSTDLIHTSSPFDAIKQSDEAGEFWSARDLQPILGYERWESFNDAVMRASISAINSQIGGNHFRGVPKLVSIGSSAVRQLQDYRLTRFGAYLVAMNGDPRKPEIAQAQTYFAVKTREAEVRVELDELEVARRYVKAIEDKRASDARAELAEAALAEAAPKVEGYDRLIAADGARRVGQVAKELGWKENALRSFLIEERLIFVRQAVCGQTQYEPYAAYSAHFRPVETVVTHRFGDCAHFTLTVEQRGIDLIRKRIADRKAALNRELTSAH